MFQHLRRRSAMFMHSWCLFVSTHTCTQTPKKAPPPVVPRKPASTSSAPEPTNQPSTPQPTNQRSNSQPTNQSSTPQPTNQPPSSSLSSTSSLAPPATRTAPKSPPPVSRMVCGVHQVIRSFYRTRVVYGCSPSNSLVRLKL